VRDRLTRSAHGGRPTPDADADAGAGGDRPLRIGIVGLGPKGTFALERLLDHAGRADPAAAIRIDAYEPHPVPGAGPVYDPGQPAHLRMNFAAGQVDMWWPGTTAVPPPDRRSFVDWSEHHRRPCDPATYPPRADVGLYLADGLRALLAHAPPSVAVTIRPARVRAVVRVDGGWVLQTTGGADFYDEVLIATGHDRSPGRPFAGPRRPPPVVPAVFPVERHLSPDRVPPGATVAIRGFALSFIDAALTLTEGRGGTFAPRDDEKRDRPEKHEPDLPATCLLRYRPGEDDVRVIFPFSRTGRPMLAKPAAGLVRPGLAGIADRGRRLIGRLDAPVDLRRDLLPILAATVTDNLRAAGAAPPAEQVDGWLDAALAGAHAEADSPSDELRRSLTGAADLPWALGQAWRDLYPAIVTGLGGDRLTDADWPRFRRLAAELERVSFGPPPINAAKLLALIDAGRVDLTHVRGGRVAGDRRVAVLSSARGDQAVDVVIDAVLPGPGAPAGRDALLRRLVDDGHVRIAAGRRGIDVGPDGGCRGVDGSATPGLAAIGRPTEDSVIGNDTLSRTLHPLADRWARGVVERSRRRPTVHEPTAGVAG
jgi:diaminopimelate decarboxylase